MSFSEWRSYKISEVGKVITGKTPPTKDSDNFNGEYPFITPVDMNGQKYVKNTARSLSEKGREILKNFTLPEDSICISCIGSDLGKVVKTASVSFTNQQINSIICNEFFDSDFVYYALHNISPLIRSIGRNSTAVPIINKSDFSEFEILAPESIDIQRQIGFILSSFDDKIENNLATNQTLEEIARTLFKEWFVNFNYPNADGNLKHSEFGEIPESWEVGTLGDIANQVKESIKPSSLPEKEFHHFSLPAFDSDELPSIDLGSSILSNKTAVKKYSVLFSKLNPRIPRIWSIGDIDEEISICSTEFIGFTPKQDFFYSYLNYFLKQPELVTKLTGIATGTSNSHQRIKPTDLLELEVLIPDNETIRKFEKIVKPILETRFHKILENQQLKKTRDSLLPKLMSGEIEVND